MEKIGIEYIPPGQHAMGDVRFFDQPVVTIGRAYDNDYVLPDPFVSARHCRLEKTGDGWILEDLNSENGTYSPRLKKEIRRERIVPGEEAVLGRTRLRFVSPELEVPAAKPLGLRGGRQGLNRPLAGAGLILLTMGFYAAGTYLESYERLSINKLLAVSLWQIVSVFIWASIWSFTGRLIKHRTYFWGQVSVTCLFWMVLLPVGYLVDTFGYLSTSQVAHITGFIVAGAWLFTLLLSRNLSMATYLSSWQQKKIALVISLFIVVVGTVSYVAFKDEFNPYPSYYTQLQPPFLKIRPSHSIGRFLKDSRAVFETARKKAQRAF